MEERAGVMTDKQWDNMIKMVMMIVGQSKGTDNALNALKILLRKEDAEEVLHEIEKFKAE